MNASRRFPSRRSFLSTAALLAGGTAWSNTPLAPAVNDGVKAYRGNQHRSTADLMDWQALAPPEVALEPGLPIVDPHHHLFNTASDRLYYRREDMERDLSGGHRVIGTVYVAAYGAGWRTSGPQAMRSVGEIERIVKLSETPLSTPNGACSLAAGIVSDVDLSLGDQVGEVLEAHVAAGAGRLRGVRFYATYHDGSLSKFIPNAPRHVMADAGFRQGFARLERHGLTFDALIYHTQLREIAELADAFPRTPIVVNHVGIPVGVQEFSSQRSEVRREWEANMRALASRSNVRVKVGGMGMPIFGFGFEHGEKPAQTQALVRAWQPLIDVCIEAFGPQRCMLESNFPVDKQSCSYVQLWNAFKRATHSYSTSERQALFYQTACRTYGLPKLEAACDAAARGG